jgi:RHS repeat-associated protein
LDNAAATIVDGWDGAQRLTSRTVTPGPLSAKNITFEYDDHDRLELVIYPSGRKVKYSYNAKGQLEAVEDPEPGGTHYLTSVTYKPAGDLDVITYANGRTTTYGYDSRFRPDSIDAGTRTLTLGYDDASNLDSWTGDGPARSFGYDKLNRLTSATGPAGEVISYEYTKTGDRETRTVDGATSAYIYQPSTQRLTSITGPGAISYSYDNAGRQTGAGSRTYDYTPLGTLEMITNPSRSFTYDGDGQRISRTGADGTTYYVRGPSNRVLAEYDSSDNLLREHIYALGRRIASVLADGRRFYIQHDAQGSAWIVSDEVAQEAHGPYRYWPFGSEGSAGGGADSSPAPTGQDGEAVAASASDAGNRLAAVGSVLEGQVGGRAPTGELIFADSFELGCVFAWHEGKPSDCGDGLVFPPEQCDLTCFSVPDCESLGFDGGTLGCHSDGGSGEVVNQPCTFDTSGCHVCGDNQAEGPEECDGTDLAGQSCLTLGFEGGTLACVDCAFDTSGCDNCGDGVQEPPEECDGTDFGTQSCISRGFDGGSLICTPSCTIDDTGCYVCGDNLAEGPEPCDGTDLAGQTCQTQGFVGGTLACVNCAFDTSACHNCGDNTQEPPEECDGADLGGQSCSGLGFDGGDLACLGDCSFDTSGCYECGNNLIEGPEVCDGEALGGVTCQDLGHDYGELACLPGCDGYDVSGCFNDASAEPRFTGKELESDLDLYYFGARYLDAGVGRFTTPDPGAFALSNPQTFNRYAYALNSPYRHVDPDGREVRVLTPEALLMIQLTVPLDVRQHVELDASGLIRRDPLLSVRSSDANLSALRELVLSQEKVEVTTAEQVLGERFYYESREALLEQLPSLAEDIKGPRSFLGLFQTAKELGAGASRITVSDGAGSASTAPTADFVKTMAHELYGHALLFIRGEPYMHGDPGVNTTLDKIEDRTDLP